MTGGKLTLFFFTVVGRPTCSGRGMRDGLRRRGETAVRSLPGAPARDSGGAGARVWYAEPPASCETSTGGGEGDDAFPSEGNTCASSVVPSAKTR